MSDCPHIHIQDSGLQAFRDIIHEETDGGRNIVRFFNNAMEGELPDFQPNHRLEAAKVLMDYDSKEAADYVREHTPKRRRSTSGNGRAPVQSEARPEHSRRARPVQSEARPENSPRAEGDRDPIMAPLEDEVARFIREETDNGRTIVSNLILIMETHDDPYKPQHNLAAAKQLIDNGFPPTDALICRPDCTHHSAPADGSAVSGSSAHPERSGAESKDDEEPFDKEVWDGIIAELKQLEEDNNLDPHRPIPKVDMSIYMPPQGYVMPPEVATEEAAKFRAEIALRAERRKKWPEIEERRRKKLAKIYPSHSEEDPPET